MDHSTTCACSVCEEKSCKLDVSSCEEFIEHSQCTSSCMVETAESMLLEILDVTSEQSSGLGAASMVDETMDSKEIGTGQDLSQSVSTGAKLHKGLRKCVTFPCSVGVQQKDGSQSKSVECQNSPAISSYERSVSLPASFKLVSAMKGGRVQNGIFPSEMLNVKWAPEVYDPPATSMSHTVNNHRQRTKAKKKDNHKHKNSKGKSSRGGGKEKNVNQRNTGNMPDPLDTRSLLQLNGGYARANSQEAKCRTSFLEEGLANLHLSIGEAL